jgi:PadR family transcriptional regulator, regulatory protein PadR
MAKRSYPGEFELMILLALIRVGDDAYGVPISKELRSTTGREVALGSVYAALDRLEQKELVSSRQAGWAQNRRRSTASPSIFT